VTADSVEPYTATVSFDPGARTSRVTVTWSRSPPADASNRSDAAPTRSACIGKRTSTEPPSGTSTARSPGPSSKRPETEALTVTRAAGSPFVLTTTPASTRSPARTKRGSAGRAIRRLLVTTFAEPKPYRSPSVVATAITRYVVRESGILKLTRA